MCSAEMKPLWNLGSFLEIKHFCFGAKFGKIVQKKKPSSNAYEQLLFVETNTRFFFLFPVPLNKELLLVIFSSNPEKAYSKNIGFELFSPIRPPEKSV